MNRYKILCLLLVFTATGLRAQENVERNLKIYSKVWGVCKYYSNNDNTNWDRVFLNQYDDILAAKTNDELNVILNQLIDHTSLSQENNIGNIHGFSISDFRNLKQNGDLILKTDFDWILNSENISTQNSSSILQLLREFTGQKPKTISIDDKIAAHDKELTYNSFSNKIAVLALLRLYNVIEYYYPYKHLLDTDWDSVLTEIIPEFVNCNGIQQYKNALNHFASFLQDSHVEIDFSKITASKNDSITKSHAYYPVQLDYIDHTLFVSNVLNDSIANHYKLKPGDKITRVNDKDIPSILNKVKQYYSVSRKDDSYFGLLDYLRTVDTLELTIQNRNVVLNKMVFTRDQFVELYRSGSLATTLERNNIKLDETIGYIYLPESKYSSIDNAFRRLKNKETIILDCRGYGTLAALKLAKLLSKNKKDVASASLPLKKYPGVFEKQKNETYYISNSIDLIGKFLFGYKNKVFPTFNKPYQGTVVVLVDDNAISFGETVSMIIKVYAPDATFIGRPTAGANGNVSTLTLPLGGILYYTAVDFKFADGTEVQRRGIQPDIYVPRTIKFEIAGRDEILNVALEYIESTNKKPVEDNP